MSVRVPDERLDVLTRLRNGIKAQGCLCLSSRCPIHGESTGVLAAVYMDLRASRADNQRLREALERAAYVAGHLFQMINRETWRESGGDDGQGHYEGDYRAEQTQAEILAWKAPAEEPRA